MTRALIPTLLTEDQAAELLHRTPSWIAAKRRAGDLAFIPGRPVLIELGDLLDFIEKLRSCPEKKKRKKRSKGSGSPRTAVDTGKSAGPSTTQSPVVTARKANLAGQRTALLRRLSETA